LRRGIYLSMLAITSNLLSGTTTLGQPIEGFRDTPIVPGTKWHLHDPDRPQPPVVTPATNFSLGAPAPSDAEVLFDGANLSKWQSGRGEDAPWIVKDGYMETAARQGIRTRGK